MDPFFPCSSTANKRQIVGYQYYEISATFKDAKLRKGIRATVYKSAEKYHGRCRNNVGDSIFYAHEPKDPKDLEVHLLFEEKGNAQDFLDELSRLRHEHNIFRDMIEFDREPLELSVSNKAHLIYFSDYVTIDNSESPDYLSLADLLTDYSKLTTVVYDPADSRFDLCSFEDFKVLAPHQRLFKCHIASKSRHMKYAKDMDNNIIYATQEFHNYFNGIQTDSGDAELALQYDGYGIEVSVPVDAFGTHEDRFKVFVKIIFRDEDIATFMKRRFRDYTETGPLELRSYFFVKDCEIAQAVLDIKYKETVAKWAMHGVDSDDD